MLYVNDIIRSKGITKKELAEKMNMDKAGLYKVLTGNPTLNTIIKLANVLEIPITELFEKGYSEICPHCGGKIKVNVKIEGLQ